MDIEARTMRRVTLRLVPFLILCYFVAYLDRVNVGFAKLTMAGDLHLSETAFGLGAGIFFIAYFFFEVPSNLLLERFGARKWIARIMFTWGLVSGAMALIGGPISYYVVRVLLGIAEAGFFPGIIFFLTLWFPAAYRARVVGMFMAAIPLSTVIGGPVSGLLLYMDGIAGLRGWQWLYLIEAAPALILSVVVFFYLTDRPAEATWLAADERAWLVRRQELEQRQREAARHYTVRQALLEPKIFAIAMIYFGANSTNYGLSFFLPTIVKAFGLSNAQTGFVTAIPYVVGVIAILAWGAHSDRVAERKGHVAFALLVAAAGIAGSTLFVSPIARMLLLSIAGFGIFGCLPCIWALPTAFLSGAAAAGGIAVVNSVGNLAGFFGPYAMGWLHDQTGNFAAGLWLLAALGLMGMGIALLLGHDAALERAPDGEVNPAE